MNNRAVNKAGKSGDNYWKVLNSLNTGILISAGNRNTRANRSFCKMIGYTEKELIGRPPEFLIPEDQMHILLDRAERRKSGKRVSAVFEIQIVTKAGNRLDVRTHSKEIVFGDEKATLFEFEDITSRKHAEQKLIDAKEELEALVTLRTKALAENVEILEETKNELTESRNMLWNILDHIPQRVFWKDKKSNFLGCNKTFAEDAGIEDPEDIIGKTDFDFFSRENAKLYRKDDKQVIDSGNSKINYEEPQTRNDEILSWLKTSKIPLKNSKGEIIGVLGTYEDITEKKAAEDKLRKSEERYSLVSEATNHGIWDWDVESDNVYLSPQWKKQIGYQDDELENKFSTWQNQLHPDDYEKSHETLNSYLKNPKGLFEMEFRMRHKNGSYRWIFSRAASVKNKRGNVVRMFGAHTDITAFKLAEEQLLLSESKYKTMFDSVGEPLIISDWKGNIKEVNNAALLQYGYTREEFIEMTADQIVRKDYLPVLFQWLTELQKTGQAFAETIDVCKDGTEICTEVHGKKITFNGEIHVLAQIRNVTENKKLKDDLAKYQQQLELVLNSVPVLISYLDSDLIYQFVNKGYEEWFSIKSDAIVGKHPREIIGEDAFKLVEPDMKKVLRGKVIEYERAMPYKNIGTKYTKTIFLPHIVNNQTVGIIACVNDITDVINTQNKLKTKTSDLRLINDVSTALNTGKELAEVFKIVNDRTAEFFYTKGTSGASIFTYDPRTKFIESRVNPMKSEFFPKIESMLKVKLPQLKLVADEDTFAHEVLFGSKPVMLKTHEQVNRWIEEFINRTWLNNKLIHKSLKKFVPKIREMLGIEAMCILPLIHNNVHIGLMEVSHHRQFTNEEMSRLISISAQLGASVYQRYLRDEVSESESRLSNAIKYAPFPMMIHTDDGEVLQVSDAWRRISGYDEEEISTISEWSAKVAASDKKSEENSLAELYKLKADRRHLGEFTIRAKDGSELVWDFSSAVLGKLPDGRKLGISMAMDITSRKTAEEKLRRTMQELANSNKELEQFAYVASHDLQEPLRMVSSFTQLLANKYEAILDKDGKEFIHFAVDGANRMSDLIKDLLDLSRITTRGKKFEKVNLSIPAEGAVALLKERLDSSAANITIGNLPDVKCDKSQIQRVFQNLISNAIKFKGDNPPKISIYAKNKGSYWQISVKDNGIGIDKKFHERIFVIFQRLHNRETYSGTGIGLAVTARIIDRHGGKIWVESEPGKGAAFHFTLMKEGN